MALLYADEDFSYPVVEELRRLGHDVMTIQEAGLANRKIPDVAVLAEGARLGRAVLTFNRRHFIRLHRSGVSHGGIIACTRDDDAAALAARIHAEISPLPTLLGELILIYRPG